MKFSAAIALSFSLICMSSCTKDDSNDSGDTGEVTDDSSTVTDTGSTSDTGTITTTATETGDPVSLDYDDSISIQANLDNGVPILNILEHHEVSELHGLFYEGGYIFYIDESTGSGMVSHSITDSGPTHWNDFSNPAPDLGLGSEIGTGEANTNAIVGAIGEDTYAARYAYDAEINGFNDWFLPSIDELTAVYENLHLAGLGDANGGSSYWSSTDEEVQYAWVIYFANGNTYTPNKTHEHHNVLPVRSF